MSTPFLPTWAYEVLSCPASGDRIVAEGDVLRTADGHTVGRIEDGIVRFPIASPTQGIQVYRAAGGAHFHERANTVFAMSALDTPVYHRILSRFRSADLDGIVVDVGGGDGRNARPFLEWGYRRVVVVDAVAEALARFRDRIAASQPDWLDRLLLIEADARTLPLMTGIADRVFSIETLYYLNEGYAEGLGECARLLSPTGKLLVSERDYEAGLVMRLLYFGLHELLETAGTRDLWDGNAAALVRSRCFTEAELVAMVDRAGLVVESISGTSLLALLLGWLRGQARINVEDERHRAKLAALLATLSETGTLRRCHVVVASKTARGPAAAGQPA